MNAQRSTAVVLIANSVMLVKPAISIVQNQGRTLAADMQADASERAHA